MKRITIATLALLLVLSAPAQALDHLWPEDPAFAAQREWRRDYAAMVVTVLKSIFNQQVRASMIEIPAHEPEYAVGIEGDEGLYHIVVIESAVPLRVYPEHVRSRVNVPADWHDVKVAGCDLAIDTPLAERVLNVWQAMLLETHFPMRPLIHFGPDGKFPRPSLDYPFVIFNPETYHFAMYPEMKGQTVSPAPDSKPGMLVAIAHAMRDACKSMNDDDLAELERRVATLENALRKNP